MSEGMGYNSGMKYLVLLAALVVTPAYAGSAYFIGDSLSNEYTPFVQQFYPCVVHNPGNAHSTKHILANLDAWLGHKHYSVIHFNAGMWDILRRDPNGVWNTAYPRFTSPEEYRENLGKIVTILQAHADVVIFATTTPVPQGAIGRLNSDAELYNSIAVRLMLERGVIVDDLNYAMQGDDMFRIRPNSVHFRSFGAFIMANQVEQVLLPFLSCHI